MNEILKLKNWFLGLLAIIFMVSTMQAQQSSTEKNPWDRQVFFGEQHLHTQDSPDAFAMGVRNTQDDAYNFAKGLPVKKVGQGYANSGATVQKRTPYDWAAVTDHAFMLGLLPPTLDKSSDVYNTEIAKLIRTGDSKKMDHAMGIMMDAGQLSEYPKGFGDIATIRSAWDKQKQITNKHNDPGTFTTLIAFEWTSIPNGQNLHRNVFFRGDVGPASTFSTVDSDRAEDLWTYMEVMRDQGLDCFAIPHNGNVSNSLMFSVTDSYGQPITANFAKRRQLNEVATEIIQTKGQSETHPALSPNDEFADFELFRHLLGTGGQRGLIDHSYVRQALINGIGFQEMLGVNPFKYGIVSGADAHTAFSDNEEFNYTGVHGVNDDSPQRRLSGAGQTAGEPAYVFGTPGTTAVYADENTRPGIYDAIKRKETYGTSGTFIRLRFFGGWEYEKNIIDDPEFLKMAYLTGVPMGGDLREKPSSAKAPTFIVQALKDPESGNLDRIQIVKGWYKNGYGWEKVYDVAWSDNRVPVAADGKPIEMVRTDGHKTSHVTHIPEGGKLPPVGNTVNVKKATYTNKIGDSQLQAVWTDPDFDPSLHAVYYVRVLEIPTPRWSTYDAVELGIEVPFGLPTSIQERAWSSPIWYTPDPELVKKAPWYPGLRQSLKN